MDSVSKNIPEDVVESAYEAVAQLSDDAARQEITRLTKVQPALLAFVMASTEDLSKDAMELGVYMFVVICRMYETHFGDKLQNVGAKRVEEAHAQNEAELESLLDVDESEILAIATSRLGEQPFVMRYVSECLFEPEDEDINLSEEDQGALMMTMKTVIDCLDSSIRL